MDNNILEFVQTLIPIAIPATAVLSLTGLFPRIGPGRALWIAFRSRFSFRKLPLSIRNKEVEQIKKIISNKNIGKAIL